MTARLAPGWARIPLTVALAGAGLTLASAPAQAAEALGPDFAADYAITDLGTPPGVPGPLGGLTLKAGDPDTLLIGGAANQGGGAVYQIGVTRNADGHISGWSGSATLLSTAPGIDGGLAYAPNGTLLYTSYNSNLMGEILPGGSTPAKIVNLSSSGIASSVGTLQFVPAGRPGAGKFKIASYNGGGFYDVSLTDAGDGTYDVASATLTAQPNGGPEGIAYVPLGSPDFPTPSLLFAQYSQGKVVAYETDANGDPVVATGRDFITGLSGVEGAHIDAQTNDFMFSTFGGGNRVLVVNGFGAPTCRNMQTSAGVITSYDSGTGVTTYTGTDGDDLIAGTNGADVINGGGGNDTICARKGADTINGGEGRDVIQGQDGVDQVNGDAGNDKLMGNGSGDTINGGDGNDAMIGGQGTDSCDGGADHDRAKTCESLTSVP